MNFSYSRNFDFYFLYWMTIYWGLFTPSVKIRLRTSWTEKSAKSEQPQVFVFHCRMERSSEIRKTHQNFSLVKSSLRRLSFSVDLAHFSCRERDELFRWERRDCVSRTNEIFSFSVFSGDERFFYLFRFSLIKIKASGRVRKLPWLRCFHSVLLM